MNKTGRITLLLGPIFSGKTTQLIDKVRKARFEAKTSILVSFSAELNVFQTPPAATHDGTKFENKTGKTLYENLDVMKEYDVVAIDNGQFFPDLVEVVCYLGSIGKEVVVACLNSDYNLEPFINVSKLIPFANKVKSLCAYCFYCHREANCSLRLADSGKALKVYPSDMAKPVCRNCYKFFTEHDFRANEKERSEKERNEKERAQPEESKSSEQP